MRKVAKGGNKKEVAPNLSIIIYYYYALHTELILILANYCEHAWSLQPLSSTYESLPIPYMPCIAQFSGEELHELKEGAWENPAYDNMDQLMDER